MAGSRVLFSLLVVGLGAGLIDGRKLSGLESPDINLIDDPKALHGIDFSRAQPGPDGTVCVQRKKYVDKTEKDQLKECFVQNVTQCYYTYITEYTDGIQEKCEDFYWKTCKIVFKERVFNATSRSCKRPLVKNCDPSTGSAEPKIVCETFFETECNTTTVAPASDVEPLDVTFCDKIPRKICAPDNCRVEEGPEDCSETSDESTIEQPIELCDLQPQKHCSQEKISVPRLIPEQKCRQVEKEICNTQMVNPHDIKKPVFIKYCTRKENLAKPTTSSYLPPGGPPADSPRSSFGGGPPPPTVSVARTSELPDQIRTSGSRGTNSFRLPNSSPFGPPPNQLRLQREAEEIVASAENKVALGSDDLSYAASHRSQAATASHPSGGAPSHHRPHQSIQIKRSGRSLFDGDDDWVPKHSFKQSHPRRH